MTQEEADVPGHEHPELEVQIEELASAVIGPRKTDLAGGGRDEEEGLIHQVQRINNKLSNGGIRIKLPIGIWVAVIAAVSGIIIQLIATAGGGG